MFSGRENPQGAKNLNLENLFEKIFESKKQIVEQAKHQVDLHDRQLASKCLLSGISLPPWIWSPSLSLPSQTSELNKEEIISGLLFPQSRPSIICPSRRPFSYQQPVSFPVDSVVRKDLTSVVNNPFEEQLFEEEEEQQHDLSHNLVRRTSNNSRQKDAHIASPKDVHEEGLPESVSICCRENQSCLSPKYSQNQRVLGSLDVTSPGCSQGKTVPKSVSTTCCEQNPPSPGNCQDETEPNTGLDPVLPLAKIQRSKSRQKALEIRSSAKASRSRSNNKNELKPSPVGNTGLGIASLRSESVTEIKLFKRDENDEGCQGKAENSKSKGEEGDQFIKFSSTTECSTPHQVVDSVRKTSIGDVSASIVPESLLKHVNEMDTLQYIETIEEVSAKVDEQVSDPQSSSCIERAYLNGGTRSKSSNQDSSKRKHPQSKSFSAIAYLDGGTRFKSLSQGGSKRKRQKSSNFFSDDFSSSNSNPSYCADHEVELVQVVTTSNEVSVVTNARTSIFQAETTTRSESNTRANISKTEHSGSVESTSVDLEPIDSVSLLQGGHVKESLNPSTGDVDSLVVENITSDDQSKEIGTCVDTTRCSSAERVSQTGISTDEATFGGTIQDSVSKTNYKGFVESSSVELQSRHLVMQSNDKSVLVKPVTVTALLVEEDKDGESIEMNSISKPRNLSQIDIMAVEPVIVKSTHQESGTPKNLIDHSERCDTSCVPKKVQPQGSLTKAESNQCHGRISRPRNSPIEEEEEEEEEEAAANDYKALSVGYDHKSADEQLAVRAGNSSFRTSDHLVCMEPESPHCDDNEERKFNQISMNSREKATMEKGPTPASAERVFPSLTDSEVNLSADNEMNDISHLKIKMVLETESNSREKATTEKGPTPASAERVFPYLTDSEVNLSADNEMNDISRLKIKGVLETESNASHTGLKVRENDPPGSNTCIGNIDALANRPQHKTFSVEGVSPISRNIACTEIGESHGPESSVREFFCPISSVGSSQLQKKRRSTLDKLTSRVPSSSPGGDILDSDSVRETVHDMEEASCHNLDCYDDELQKMIESASSDLYPVELQKMMGSASSAELRFEECHLFKEAALLSFRPEQLSVQRSRIAPGAGETANSLASCVVRDSDNSPVLEGFIIQSDDEYQSGSRNPIYHDSFQLPRTSAESAAIMEQMCKSTCMTTPSLHLAKSFKFGGEVDLDQSVSTELLDGMYYGKNLEGNFVFDNLGINHDFTRKSYTDCLPFYGAGSSADSKNLCVSPAEKLWYRNLQKSSSSEKRVSQTPDLPCISEENENIDEEAENLCTNNPKSMSSEKRGSSVPDLPCIAEENENIDEITEAVIEASYTKRENVSAERKPLGDVNEDPMKFLPPASDVKIPVDRQSLDSVNTTFSFSAKSNHVKNKVGKQNGGKRRFTGKGKENQGGASAGRNVRQPSSRVSKLKLSCNSSLTTVGPQLPDKEPRYNNIVSNITSFVPLVQQQKPAPPLITGKRDVKVKALEAAEASRRIAEQKENDRKVKKEAMKLERARQEQENLRKQEMEKQKKEEDRKKKEAEMAWKQEIEKKKKEEERKRKEFEMADRKRQREEEEKKLKEAKRQRIAEIQKQRIEADQKLQAEKELKRQAAMDARIKAQKELKEDDSKAERSRRQANTKIPDGRPKSNSSEDTNASRSSTDDDFKVISNERKMAEESYDISPYKCSDDEEEEEDEDDNISNHKFVPTWASKGNILRSVISQQNCDPDIMFSRKGFSDISKVLLPRKFKSR